MADLKPAGERSAATMSTKFECDQRSLKLGVEPSACDYWGNRSNEAVVSAAEVGFITFVLISARSVYAAFASAIEISAFAERGGVRPQPMSHLTSIRLIGDEGAKAVEEDSKAFAHFGVDQFSSIVKSCRCLRNLQATAPPGFHP